MTSAPVKKGVAPEKTPEIFSITHNLCLVFFFLEREREREAVVVHSPFSFRVGGRISLGSEAEVKIGG